MREEAFSFHSPVNSGEAGGTADLNPKLCWPNDEAIGLHINLSAPIR